MVNFKGTEQIDISVLHVSQNDSGIYKSVSLQNSKVDGCCLLIITGLYNLMEIEHHKNDQDLLSTRC
jgi:hypothetical protein